MAAIASSSAAASSFFYIYKSPLVTNPPYELLRRCATSYYQWFYKMSIENEFSHKGLLQGAKMGICKSAEAMRTHDYAKLSSIMTTDALQRLRKRMNELPQSTLDQKLSFTEADIQRVFLHSFVPSSDRLFGVGQEYRPSYYATIVAFIRPPNGSLSTRLEDLLTCNITFGRIVLPLGQWRITNLNFFDGVAVRHFRTNIV